MSVRPRAILEKLPPYKAARSVPSLKREYGLEKITKLAANENTLGFSPKVLEAIKKVSSQYPDGTAYDLRKRLSEKLGVEIGQIVLGNGSFELIYLAAIAYLEKGDETIGAVPSFGWYKSVTQILGGTYIGVPVKDFHVDLEKIAADVTEKTKIIWLCNPNNPTGTIFTERELEDFLSKIRDDILVILDEAYVDFVAEDGFPDSISLLKKHDNIAIFRTFSKLEGLASFRVGYAISTTDFVDTLNKIRIPSNVNAPAQLAALVSIDDEEFKNRTLTNAREQKKFLYGEFKRLGLSYVPSNTNFIFFDIGVPSTPIVEKILKKGFLIRGGAEYGFDTMIRLTIGTPEENAEFISILEGVLGGKDE
ncbi:MAG: histidinol-phosphate transaminase [Treponema sp.]|nr:histidinol-phosphate transaminase [Treponema sp.]